MKTSEFIKIVNAALLLILLLAAVQPAHAQATAEQLDIIRILDGVIALGKYAAIGAVIWYVVYMANQWYQQRKADKQKAGKPFFDALEMDKLGKFGVAVSVVIFIAFMINNDYSNYEKAPAKTGYAGLDALFLCQTALTQLSRDPDTAKVPYVENYGKGDAYYFAWGAETSYARMRNGLGLEVPVSASCVVNGRTKTITYLTFNGETIIKL